MLAALVHHGLLLKQDRVLPDVVGMVAGEKLATSWWGHPQGRRIFAVLSELADHEDVLFVKLVGGKDTLVHRRHWPELLAIGAAREPWQLRGLAPASRSLLAQLDSNDAPVRAAGAPAKELQLRLLGVAREVHTVSGRHELALESWQAWAKRLHCRPAKSVPLARELIEGALAAMGGSRAALPWPAMAKP